MHIIDAENMIEANDAIRDILMMYLVMADYNGFGHGVSDEIRFDPLKFVDARSDGHYVDLDVLRTGSALGFLARIVNQWLENEAVLATEAQLNALESGKLSRFPDIESVSKEALKRKAMSFDDPWFDTALQQLYRKYVLSFFKRLSESDRP